MPNKGQWCHVLNTLPGFNHLNGVISAITKCAYRLNGSLCQNIAKVCCVCVCVYLWVWCTRTKYLGQGAFGHVRHVYLSFLQIHKRIAKGYLNVQFKEKCSTKVSHDDDIYITSNTKVSSSVCMCVLVLSTDKSVQSCTTRLNFSCKWDNCSPNINHIVLVTAVFARILLSSSSLVRMVRELVELSCSVHLNVSGSNQFANCTTHLSWLEMLCVRPKDQSAS